MTTPQARPEGTKLLLVSMIAVLIALGIATRAVQQADWDMTVLVAFGEDATAIRDYAEERLGDVFLRPMLGHDGRFFFVQSNDPWVLNPDENAMIMDRPLYRSQRMLYPLLAGGFGLFGPEAIVWSMLIVNLLAMGFGTWAVARIAQLMGGSPWWGLAFALNLGFVSELNIGGAGVVSAAAAFWAVYAVMRGNRVAGAVLLALAALAREAMLVAAAGTAFWLWTRGERKDSWLAVLVPVAAVATWAVYIRSAIDAEGSTFQVEEIGWPFLGFIEAFRSWLGDPVDLAVGVAVLLLFVLFTRRALISRQLVGFAFIGFVLLGIVFTEQVWHSYFDITRAVAPIITSFVLLVFLDSEPGSTGSAEAINASTPDRTGSEQALP